MNYPSIRIEGGILSPDILDRIEDADGQKPAHFELDSPAKVKDEILRVWADAQDLWRIFQRKLESLKADSPATTETRNLWIVPLLSLLGYQLEYQARGTELNGKNYPISHRVTNRKQTPLHIVGYREPSGLDRKPEKMALRMSAHALVQEYLNLSDELYGIVTNGRLLRVLRDSSRLVKLSYLEFDLDRIFTDGLFADFAVLFRLLHATRLPKNEETAASCWLERYHQKSIDEGTRIRDGLRDAVTEALELLGTGFLAHPENAALRQQISSGELRPETYFNHLLRLVYRLLFLMVVEERGLVFPKSVPAKNVSLYLQHYSIQRLRRLAVTRGLKIERFHDAWLSLLATFRLFENPAQAAKLGTTVFGGQLFYPESLGPLIKCRLTNAALFTALERLCYFDHPETKQRTPVNFGALATEEFGSVYESLLELHPVVEIKPTSHFGFRQVAGNERKTTGSYYTPTSLVTCLLDSALDPVLEERIQNFKALGFKSVDEAVLALNVCDPACGSGHFLIAAAQRMTRRLALLRAGDEEPSPELLRHTLREVIGNCIHGVDVNPMSVELCKVALWLEAVEPGKPLNFLDHHIKYGNSLLGATPECIRDGIPDKAYEPITGDNKEAAKWMRQLNKEAREGQGHFDFAGAAPWERLGNLPAAMAELETLEDETPEALAKKEKYYRQIVEGAGYESARLLHDTWCAAFVWPKHKREYGSELTTEHLRKIERTPHSVSPGLKLKVRELALEFRFFHWHLEFPTVFGPDGEGGFDIMLGNPPWERVKLQEEEFFASRDPEIAKAKNAAARKKMIAALPESNPALAIEWETALRIASSESKFLRLSGRYPFGGVGDVNTYAVFADLFRQSINANGAAALLLPNGLVTGFTYRAFLRHLLESRTLASFYGFENEDKIFPEVHNETKFGILTMTGTNRPVERPWFTAHLRQPDELLDPLRRYSLTADQIEAINPNTLNLPAFRWAADADVTATIHAAAPVLLRRHDKDPVDNPWGVSFRTMFHMANDSGLFLDHSVIAPHVVERHGSLAVLDDGSEVYPLYEGKILWHFDHRYGTYEGQTQKQANKGVLPHVDDATHDDPNYRIQPRYWVPADQTRAALGDDVNQEWFFAWRDVGPTERTFVGCLIPRTAAGHKAPFLVSSCEPHSVAGLTALLSSLVLDYDARQRSSGMSFFVVEQLAVLPPEALAEYQVWLGASALDWLAIRVLELSYTNVELAPFAQDIGYHLPPFRWLPERRTLLQAEIDAATLQLYRLSRSQAEWLLDSFTVLRKYEEDDYGEFRTKRLVLEIYDRLAESQRTGRPYVNPLKPPPGAPTDEHGHFIPMSQWDPNHWPSHIHPPRDEKIEVKRRASDG